MSYTSFAYSDLQIVAVEKEAASAFLISAIVKNIGAFKGDEVVQLYVGPHTQSTSRPPKELKGFIRVTLDPGAESHVQFQISARDLPFYDVRTGGWKAVAGTYTARLGASSRDIRLAGAIQLEEDWLENVADNSGALTLDSPIPRIMAQKQGALFAALGEAAQTPQMMMLMGHALEEGLTINDLSNTLPDLLTPETLEKISAILQT